MSNDSAQSFAVKRAQVEFHNFASLGEPERAQRIYGEENRRRGGLIAKHRDFIGQMTPFLEVGANAGHTSYLLANEFGADGFALDISADSLRHGIALQHAWGYQRAPVRVGGDALNLPFRDNSLRFVMTHQTLSQFLDIEKVIVECKRVLAPGGVFFFSEEPLLRKLSMRLYRCPYEDTMKPWERRLHKWGLLGYLVKDVIGAHQEESFGIRQNHTMELRDWDQMILRHFPEHRYEMFVPRRGWGEVAAYRVAKKIDKHGTDWVPARLLGGTLAAFCRKPGGADVAYDPAHFETVLRCPDCHGALARGAQETLRCACGYSAADESGVYNLIRADERRELYPGDRGDLIDCSIAGHEAKLGSGWHDVEGIHGNKYRWMSGRAVATLTPVHPGNQAIRLRGFAQPEWFKQGSVPEVVVRVNGTEVARQRVERNGLLVMEAPVAAAAQYQVELAATPVWRAPDDTRELTLNVSLIRLIDL
jgi:ubiquinone/menaquinone biosynthesis C-methylase UbiE